MLEGSAVLRLFEALGRTGHVIRIVPQYLMKAFARIFPFSTTSPAQDVERAYEAQAIELLDLPELWAEVQDRVRVDQRLERLWPNETDLTLHVARLTAASVIRNHWGLLERDSAHMALRSQHAKHHGCIGARFLVADDVPDTLASGVFQPGASYDATLRFSNSSGTIEHDRKGDGRGLAIKLRLTRAQLDRQGGTSVGGRRPGGPQYEQDFLLANFPTFFVDDVREYDRFMTILHGPSRRWTKLILLILFFVPLRIGKGITFFRLLVGKIDDPLTVTYHSMSAYLLGDGNVVRYIVSPAVGSQQRRLPADGQARGMANYLRRRMVERIAPVTNSDEPNAAATVAFDFSVQIRARPTARDSERISRRWRRQEDRTIRLARLEVPAQNFDSPSRLYECENLIFSPWNFIPEHRPIGSINRVRLLSYLASARLRRRLNMASPDDT